MAGPTIHMKAGLLLQPPISTYIVLLYLPPSRSVLEIGKHASVNAGFATEAYILIFEATE